MKIMKTNRIIFCMSIIGLAVLLLMLTITSPTEIGPFGVLLFFTTVYLVFFCLFTLVYQAFKKIALKKTHLSNKDYLYTAVFAFGPIMLLMARSFGVVNPWTLSLITLFLILAEFLVHKKA